MRITTDLFRNPVHFARLPPRSQAVRLYELADLAPRDSAERADLLARAGAAQRKADIEDAKADRRREARAERCAATIKRVRANGRSAAP